MKHSVFGFAGQCIVLLYLALFCGGDLASRAAGPKPDWEAVQHELHLKLFQQKADLAGELARVLREKPQNGTEALYKLAVLLQAGASRESSAALNEIKAFYPNLDNDELNSIYYAAVDQRHELWDVARALVETFAGNLGASGFGGRGPIDLEGRLLRHLLESGWSVEKVDAWLAGMPPGINGFWMKNRMQFNTNHGRAEQVIQEMSDRARQKPGDIDLVLQFLDGLSFGQNTGKQAGWDPEWMTREVKPKLATQAGAIAGRLQRLDYCAAALFFFDQAIAIPLTTEEIRQLGMYRQIVMPGESLKAEFDADMRQDKSGCLLRLGRAAEAQQWMEQAEAIRQENHLGTNRRFAGVVQSASGARAIEGQIRAGETVSEKDPGYWRERAQYYQGRGEAASEEEALKKGLALTKPTPPARGKAPSGERVMLLRQYADFLKRAGRPGEALTLLRGEIATAPPDAESTLYAAHALPFDFQKEIGGADEVLWTWLARRPVWDYGEERLLWRMLENTPRAERGAAFTRAEKLALEGEPSRAFELGWILNRMSENGRALPLLLKAAGTQDKELKAKVQMTLLEAYLDAGDWKQAEAIFPEASQRLTDNEQPEWLCRIALAAARAGSRGDTGARAAALRLWRTAANSDPSMIMSLNQMATAGLREELTAFYHEMQDRMPASEYPRRALKLLAQ